MKLNLKLPNVFSASVNLFGMLLLGFIVSCDKNSNPIDDSLPNGNAILTINVEEIADEQNNDSNASKASTAKTFTGTNQSNSLISSKNMLYQEFDAVVSLRKDKKQDNRTIISNNKTAKSSGPELHAAAMTPGIKYRLLLYLNGVFVKSIHAESGVASHVEVNKDVEYNWYAYSYNTSEDVLDVTNPNAPTIESKIDKPLLYASGTVMVTGEGIVDKPLRVKFAHRTARIGAELNAKGMFAGIQNIKARFANDTYVQTGNLNLLTGNYEGTTSVPVGDLSFSNYSDETKDTIKVAYYYTAAQDPISPFVVNVESFTLNLDKGDTRTFSTAFQYSMSLDPLNWGYRLTSALDLIESPVTVAGVKWARANLYFSETDRAYRFRHQIDASYGRSTEEYWNFKAPFPNGTIGAQDPCTRVYPLNKWRMPNREEIQSLTNVSSGRTLNADYVEYTAIGTANPYPSNKLRINKMGYYNIALGIFGILSDNGVDGYLWSSETGFLGGAVTGAFGYRVSDNRELGLFGDYVWEHWALSSWGGAENVRCVRND